MKAVTVNNPAVSINPAPEVRILKIGTCPSLSGQSQLQFQVGVNDKSDILFRITGNTGSGVFGNEWIALADIQYIFDAIPPGKYIRSALLQPLFRTKSSNTPAFQLAVLVSCGLVAATENQGYYQRTDPGKFQADVAALVDAGVDLSGENKAVPEKVSTRKKKGVADTDSAPASKGGTAAA